MNEEQERERFEAWVETGLLDRSARRFGEKASNAVIGRYINSGVEDMWEAWKAAVKQSQPKSGAGEPIPCRTNY